MKKLFLLISSILLVAVVLTGCNTAKTTTGTPTAAPSNATVAPSNATPDTSSSASMVTDEAKLATVAGANGSWIVVLQKDLTAASDVIVEGAFKDPNTNTPKRLLAFYNTAADNRTINSRFSLLAPKVIIRSESTVLKGGTIDGDVYVEAMNFSLVDATIAKNIYFKTAAMQDSFLLDGTSKVLGTNTIG